MKYRVLDPNLTAVSQGEFRAVVQDSMIDLPDDLARELVAVGMIAPVTEYQETADDGLRQPERRQSRARQRRDD